MVPVISIFVGGVLTLLLALFHARFYRMFNWAVRLLYVAPARSLLECHRLTLKAETRVQIRISRQNSSDLFAGKWLRAPAITGIPAVEKRIEVL